MKIFYHPYAGGLQSIYSPWKNLFRKLNYNTNRLTWSRNEHKHEPIGHIF